MEALLGLAEELGALPSKKRANGLQEGLERINEFFLSELAQGSDVIYVPFAGAFHQAWAAFFFQPFFFNLLCTARIVLVSNTVCVRRTCVVVLALSFLWRFVYSCEMAVLPLLLCFEVWEGLFGRVRDFSIFRSQQSKISAAVAATLELRGGYTIITSVADVGTYSSEKARVDWLISLHP